MGPLLYSPQYFPIVPPLSVENFCNVECWVLCWMSGSGHLNLWGLVTIPQPKQTSKNKNDKLQIVYSTITVPGKYRRTWAVRHFFMVHLTIHSTTSKSTVRKPCREHSFRDYSEIV